MPCASFGDFRRYSICVDRRYAAERNSIDAIRMAHWRGCHGSNPGGGRNAGLAAFAIAAIVPGCRFDACCCLALLDSDTRHGLATQPSAHQRRARGLPHCTAGPSCHSAVVFSGGRGAGLLAPICGPPHVGAERWVCSALASTSSRDGLVIAKASRSSIPRPPRPWR
jgi:hypothetical protein